MVRRLSSARSRLFRSFRSLSKLRLEGGGQRAKSQQKQPAGKKKRVSKVLQSQFHAEQPAPAQNREHCECCRRRVNLQAKDQPQRIFLSVGLAQDWRMGQCHAQPPPIQAPRLFITLTSRCPGLPRGARASMISGPILLNSILGTHSQGMKR